MLFRSGATLNVDGIKCRIDAVDFTADEVRLTNIEDKNLSLIHISNMSECTGTAPVTPEPDKDAETDVPAPKPEKKSNIGMILVILALAGAAGAAYYYIKLDVYKRQELNPEYTELAYKRIGGEI